jgi:hypothetical protein
VEESLGCVFGSWLARRLVPVSSLQCSGSMAFPSPLYCCQCLFQRAQCSSESISFLETSNTFTAMNNSSHFRGLTAWQETRVSCSPCLVCCGKAVFHCFQSMLRLSWRHVLPEKLPKRMDKTLLHQSSLNVGIRMYTHSPSHAKVFAISQFLVRPY